MSSNKKYNIIICCLSVVIVILLGIVSYFMFFKKCDEPLNCSTVTIKEVEVDPSYQLINYQGATFRMPLDWKFVSKDNLYNISNKSDDLFVTLNSLDVSYDEFVTNLYQKNYLELLQTSSNVKIDSSSHVSEKKEDYFIYEGSYNSYEYLLIALDNDDSVILVNCLFTDKATLNKYKDSVIKFASSSFEYK